jgi:hypothetical protein
MVSSKCLLPTKYLDAEDQLLTIFLAHYDMLCRDERQFIHAINDLIAAFAPRVAGLQKPFSVIIEEDKVTRFKKLLDVIMGRNMAKSIKLHDDDAYITTFLDGAPVPLIGTLSSSALGIS